MVENRINITFSEQVDTIQSNVTTENSIFFQHKSRIGIFSKHANKHIPTLNLSQISFVQRFSRKNWSKTAYPSSYSVSGSCFCIWKPKIFFRKLRWNPFHSRVTLELTYHNEDQPNPLAIIRLFTPDSSWTWYLMESDRDDTLFGLVAGLETEFGYVRRVTA